MILYPCTQGYTGTWESEVSYCGDMPFVVSWHTGSDGSMGHTTAWPIATFSSGM